MTDDIDLSIGVPQVGKVITVAIRGTRRVIKRGPIEWRVVCKDCGTGGIIGHASTADAVFHAECDRAKHCSNCHGDGLDEG